ncbi:hypothetical protein PVAND_013220 [Polypedilum vanderplanki]|uniref:SOCS box domain-containing protein n=1 Tax=Polypedilum vanderplanki TaxID=319348 RepID=A0A9J6CPQ2_POLVA|nr:hypothetical protein PVAND_013220 [Polypedilum vanderplanki]
MNLSVAVRQNDIERIKELLSNPRINVNATDNHNFTALHHAVSNKNTEACRLLLKHKKIDVSIRTFEGLTALFLAIVSNCNLEILEMLIKKNRQMVNIKNNEEVACIHEAVKNRRLDIVKLLIENGAAVNCYDLDHENCMHLAASNCDYDMIEYLLKETEIDPTAKNRDEMNPLCLLIVRSRNEPADVVIQCFHLLLEYTYEKDILTGSYTIEDIFQPAFLATVYSHTEIAKFIIHNIYSNRNSKYEFIKKLCDACTLDEDEEFLYYLLVFLHDKIDQYDKFSFPRFSEINYFMHVRSVIYAIQKLLDSYESTQLAISLLNELESIEIRIKVREFEDQVGVMLYDRFTNINFHQDQIENIKLLLNYFYENEYNINVTIKSVLHSIAVAKENQVNILNSAKEILKLLIPYNTNFFADVETWKQINEFKNLNDNIQIIVHWLNENYGNTMTNLILDMKIVYSLKHLCRNVLRDRLKNNLKSLQKKEIVDSLKLPDLLINYLLFKQQ